MVLNTDFGKQRRFTYYYTLFLILLKLFVNVKTMLRGWVLRPVPYQLPNYINNHQFAGFIDIKRLK